MSTSHYGKPTECVNVNTEVVTIFEITHDLSLARLVAGLPVPNSFCKCRSRVIKIDLLAASREAERAAADSLAPNGLHEDAENAETN